METDLVSETVIQNCWPGILDRGWTGVQRADISLISNCKAAAFLTPSFRTFSICALLHLVLAVGVGRLTGCIGNGVY
jgi:hypothetical protein